MEQQASGKRVGMVIVSKMQKINKYWDLQG